MKLSDRIEDAYSWLENETGATLNRLDIEEVRALEAKLSDTEKALKYCQDDKEVMQNIIDVAEDNLDKLPTQQKPTEEAMEEA